MKRACRKGERLRRRPGHQRGASSSGGPSGGSRPGECKSRNTLVDALFVRSWTRVRFPPPPSFGLFKPFLGRNRTESFCILSAVVWIDAWPATSCAARLHPRHLGPLQHDLRNQNRIRIRRLPPGQIPLVLAVPGQDGRLHRTTVVASQETGVPDGSPPPFASRFSASAMLGTISFAR